MWFFDDYINITQMLDSSNNSTKAQKEYEKLDDILSDYDLYYKKNIDKLPNEFLKTYEECERFEGWDLSALFFEHTKRNFPKLKLILTHPSPYINKKIIVDYINVKHFNTSLQNNYFMDLCFQPGMIFINEFSYTENMIMHKFYFSSTQNYIVIGFNDIQCKIVDN